MTEIRFFKPEGRHGFLSNFFRWRFVLDCQRWETVEHYFQAAKFNHHPELAERTRLLPCPDAAKSFTHERKSLWRPDWTQAEVRDEVMRVALRAKFGQSAFLMEELVATGEAELKEDSPYDGYWGVGPTGTGKNRLGQLLMELRSEIKAEVPAKQCRF